MKNKMPNSPFVTRMSGSAKETELRIRSIFQWKKKRPPVILFLAAVLAVAACGGLVGFYTATPESVEPEIVMEIQYYDTYENYIEIPQLIMPDGEETNEAVAAINQVLTDLKGEYRAILNGAVGYEKYGLDGVGNHCLFYPTTTDRYINLLFFREIEVTDLNTGHVLSLVYDKEERRQVTIEDALVLAGVTEQELYGALSAQYDPQLAQVHPDAQVIIQNQALEGFRMDGDGQPVFYLTARSDDADDTVQDSVSGAENLFIWSDGKFVLYDQYMMTNLKPLIRVEETVKLNPPLWCQWYFDGGEPEGDLISTYRYVNQPLGFTVELPLDWREKIEIEEQYGLPHGDQIVTVYHKEMREKGESGVLFKIICYPGDLRTGYLGSVVLQTEKYTYMFYTPSGVEYSETDERLAEEYREMTEQFAFIMAHIGLITPASTGDGGQETAQSITDADLRNIYADVLENLVDHYTLPDGSRTEAEGSQYQYDVIELNDGTKLNQFAVCDVDGDGKEELILLYSASIYAGYRGYIFAYDERTKEIKTQLEEFPMLTFYDNGVVKAGWSHNQVGSREFWPYYLYQYQLDSDSYVLIGGAADGYHGGYYIPSENDIPTTSVSVDESVYNAWFDSYMDGAAELLIPYMALTKENIQSLRAG